MKKYIIAPSVLSANFMDLKKELKKCTKNKIEWIHYDVMDFDFVPNLTFGSKILKDIKTQTNLKIDIHFMIKSKTKPFEEFFKEYVALKPELMTMHIEAMDNAEVEKFLQICEKNKIGASLAVSPKTDVKIIEQYLPRLANVLVMSVEPGFGGQKFINSSIDKIKWLAGYKSKNKLTYTIEVDGGINYETSRLVKEAGVEMIVAGSYLFESKEFKTRAKDLIEN